MLVVDMNESVSTEVANCEVIASVRREIPPTFAIRRMPPPGITTWITWCGTWMPMVVWRSSTPHLYAMLRPSKRKARWNGPSRPPETTWGAIRGPKCWMFWGCWEVASCWQFKALHELGWRKPHWTRSTQNKISGISHCCYSNPLVCLFSYVTSIGPSFPQEDDFFPYADGPHKLLGVHHWHPLHFSPKKHQQKLWGFGRGTSPLAQLWNATSVTPVPSSRQRRAFFLVTLKLKLIAKAPEK